MGVRAKEAIAITLLTFLVAATTSLVHLAQLSRVVVEEEARQADLIARQVSAQANRALASAPGRDPRRILRQSPELRSLLEATVGISANLLDVMIVDRDGLVVTHSERPKEGATAPHRLALGELLAVDPVRRLATLARGGTVYEASLPITLNGQPFGTIRLGISTTLLRRELGAALRQSLVVTAVAMVLAWLVAMALAQVIVSPLRALARDVGRLRRGELLEAAPGSRDELGELAAQLRLLGKQVETDRVRMLTEKSTLRQMVDHLEDAVIFFNHEHRVLSFSRSAEGILGAPLEEAVGRALDDLLPPTHPLHALVADPRDRGATRNRTISLVGDDGEARDYLVSAWPVKDGERLIGAMVLLRNLQSIRGVQSLISYSAKLAALGGLTSGVTHEVKNPLNAMMIHLEIVRSRLGPRTDDVGRSLEVIGGEIRRLDRVVQGFLKFARPQELKLTAVDLNVLVSSITSLLEEEWRPTGLRVALALSPGLPAVTGDEELLRQAFFNIIQNAGQAMPSGGTATIRTVLDEAGRVSLSIADEGVGIPADDLDKVFKLYYTTRPDGNGIGLALVYRIVQMHDGSIALTSEVGRGTTVTVSLPAS
ncbi:MAG: ATP-binding protein [Candidatus Rokuibacteriota bacterium]